MALLIFLSSFSTFKVTLLTFTRDDHPHDIFLIFYGLSPPALHLVQFLFAVNKCDVRVGFQYPGFPLLQGLEVGVAFSRSAGLLDPTVGQHQQTFGIIRLNKAGFIRRLYQSYLAQQIVVRYIRDRPVLRHSTRSTSHQQDAQQHDY